MPSARTGSMSAKAKRRSSSPTAAAGSCSSAGCRLATGRNSRSAAEQFRDAADRGGIHRQRSLGGEPRQVVRSAGLRAGARQPFAAEGLHADHGTDHAAVDVDIADARFPYHVVDEALDAAVDAEREAVAGIAQPGEDAVEIIA